MSKPKKRIVKTSAAKKEFYQILDRFDYSPNQIPKLSDEERQEVKEQIVRPLIALASKKKKLDFNISGSQHSQNVISLALEFELTEEVEPLFNRQKFDPHRMNYFEIVHQKRLSTHGEESRRWGKLLEALINQGAFIPSSFRGNVFSPQFSRLSINLNHFGNSGYQGEEKCVCCFEQIKENEPYFWGLSNCECVIHFECVFTFISNMMDNLTNPNPLERQVPKCPICKVTLSPTFINQVHRTLFQTCTIDNPFIEFLPSNLKDFRPILKKFRSMNIATINKSICLLKYAHHPNRQNCQTADCGGFILVPPGESKQDYCWKCNRLQNFVGNTKKKESVSVNDRKELLELIQSNSKKHRGIRPCPNCHQLIQKGPGCNDMHCEACNTPFRWSRALLKTPNLKKAGLKK